MKGTSRAWDLVLWREDACQLVLTSLLLANCCWQEEAVGLTSRWASRRSPAGSPSSILAVPPRLPSVPYCLNLAWNLTAMPATRSRVKSVGKGRVKLLWGSISFQKGYHEKNHMTSTVNEDVGKADPPSLLLGVWTSRVFLESLWRVSQTKTGTAILFLFSKLKSNKQATWFRVMRIVPKSKRKDCLQICPTTLPHHCFSGKCTLCLSCPVYCFNLIMLFPYPRM